jgi:4-hydroxythreonine-4-phosphate dehydrogenase
VQGRNDLAERRKAREILMRPIIALAMGDPAGISPVLTARLLTLDDVVSKARIVAIGDRRVLDDGARVAGVTLDLISASPDADLSKEQRAPIFIDLDHLDPAYGDRDLT